jgi:glycosyltransferase involved in cell wall biosynthesis
VTAVHQLVPSATPRDAVTNQAFAWRELLARWGHPGEIVAEHVHPELADQVHRLDRSAKRLLAKDAVILRYALWSKTAEVALRRPERLAVVYHNITPGELVHRFNPQVAALCDRGREALRRFAPAKVLIADSEFNARELEHATGRDPAVVPLLLDTSRRAGPSEAHRHPTVLSVGRIVPNKRLEDVVKAFALYQRHRAPDASLVFVGTAVGFENYRRALEQLVDRVRARRVFFTGPLSSRALHAWYEHADAYLSMSVHEGFCAPLVEAMAHGKPVVARGAAAIPETLSGAGLVLEDGDLPLAAEALHEVVSSPQTRLGLSAAVERRLNELEPSAIVPRIRAALAPILDGE